MPYVEMMGLPGVGKTTLHQRLLAQSSDPGFRSFGSCMRDLEKIIGKREFALSKRTALKVAESNFADWLDVVVEGFRRADCSSVLLIKRISWLQKAFERAALLQFHGNVQNVVFDEFLMQYGMSLALSGMIDEGILNHYYSLCPKPEVLVVMSCCRVRLVERMKGRAEVTHRGARHLDYDLLEWAMSLGVAAGEASNVKILRVDGNKTEVEIYKAVRAGLASTLQS